MGKSRTKAFKSIIDKIWKKLQDWKLKLLSQAGREIMLKAVVQAIPTYCMSVFKLPKTLCGKINSLMQQFWWGAKKIPWLSWPKMGLSKARGGLGFRDFTCFNKALLAKQCWRLWHKPESMVATILIAKYYANGSILDAKLGSKPSFAWRSILGACDLLKEGLYCRIGNGESTRIWGDKWIPIPSTFSIQSPPQGMDATVKVSALIDKDTNGWNKGLLATLFNAEEIEAIQSVPLSCTNRPDKVIWRGSANGLFTVKSAYHMAKEMELNRKAGSSQGGGFGELWRSIWKLRIPNAEKHFLWKACKEILPTKANLTQRHVLDDDMCPICGLHEETGFHILWDCSSARDVWRVSLKKFQKLIPDGPSFRQVTELLTQNCDAEELGLFAGIARRVWLRRNEVVRDGKFTHPSALVQQAIEAQAQYVEANSPNQPVSHGVAEAISRTVPTEGYIKVNWDAALCSKRGVVGMGAVVRNIEGKVLAVRSLVMPGRISPLAAEAWAGGQALILAKEKGAQVYNFGR